MRTLGVRQIENIKNKTDMKKLGFLLVLTLCATILAASPQPSITVTGKALVAPLMKGEAASPHTRIRIHVPAGQSFHLSGITTQLDAYALQALDSLQLVATGSEASFSANQQTTISIDGLQAETHIPFGLDLHPGLNYIWLAASVAEHANIDQAVRLNAVSIQGADGTSYPIVHETEVSDTRLGIALRKPWDDGIHSYRIPGIATTNTGTLIAVYDNRYEHSGDLPANIDVGMSRSTDGGYTWEPMKVVMDMGEPQENNGVGDPAILVDPATNTIWVAALWSKGNRSIAGSKPGLSPDTTGQFVLAYSQDDGITWSEPFSITEQIKNPIWHLYFNGPGAGMVMQDGTLVFPSQYWDETTRPSRVGIPHSSIIYSKDNGKTWHSGVGAKRNTTEAQVVETTPGTLMLNMRDNRGYFRSVATTTDMGQTWTEHHTSWSALPDPVCQAALIKERVAVGNTEKDVLFFSNVNSSGRRVDMTVKASLNLGESWSPEHELLIDERPCYGYSSMSKIDEHTIGLLYEGERALYFVRIPIADIIR